MYQRKVDTLKHPDVSGCWNMLSRSDAVGSYVTTMPGPFPASPFPLELPQSIKFWGRGRVGYVSISRLLVLGPNLDCHECLFSSLYCFSAVDLSHFLYHGNASCNVTFLTIGYGDKYFGDISSYQTFSITSFSSIFYSYIGTWLWVQAQTHWSREILPDQCKDIILRSSFLLLQPFSGSKPRSTHLDGSRHFALSNA